MWKTKNNQALHTDLVLSWLYGMGTYVTCAHQIANMNFVGGVKLPTPPPPDPQPLPSGLGGGVQGETAVSTKCDSACSPESVWKPIYARSTWSVPEDQTASILLWFYAEWSFNLFFPSRPWTQLGVWIYRGGAFGSFGRVVPKEYEPMCLLRVLKCHHRWIYRLQLDHVV